MTDLPPATAAALARVARDGHLGRRPTFAHPLCTCLRTLLVACSACYAIAGDACHRLDDDVALGPWLHGPRRNPDGTPPTRQVRPRRPTQVPSAQVRTAVRPVDGSAPSTRPRRPDNPRKAVSGAHRPP